MALPGGPAERYADALARKGATVTLRRKTSSAGPTPLVNPPRISLAFVRDPVPAGAELVPVEATVAVGRLLPGDQLLIGGVAYPVTGEAAVRQPAPGTPVFLWVPVQPLKASLAAGMNVGFKFAADFETSAMVNSFPIRLVDGERIKSRDLSVLIAAWKLPDIDTAWTLIIRGREMAVQVASPTYERDEIVSWSIQAR